MLSDLRKQREALGSKLTKALDSRPVELGLEPRDYGVHIRNLATAEAIIVDKIATLERDV